jgi:hypothetical protein
MGVETRSTQARDLNQQGVLAKGGPRDIFAAFALRWGLTYVFQALVDIICVLFPHLRPIWEWPYTIFLGFCTARLGHLDAARLHQAETVYYISLAFAVAIVWVLADRRRRNERFLFEILVTVTRYSLAGILLRYGMIKVFPIQSGSGFDPTLFIQPFGEMPTKAVVGLMLSSPTYRLFAALMEIAGAFFLQFRRTATLGALIGAGALTNILVLDYAYRFEGMEWFAGQVLAMAIFLLAIDGTRLLNVFVLNRPAPPMSTNPLWDRGWAKGAALGMSLLICTSAFDRIREDEYFTSGRYRAPKSEFHGIYRVASFTRNSEVETNSTAKLDAWRVLAVDNYCKEMLARTFADSAIRVIVRPVDIQDSCKLDVPIQVSLYPPSGSPDISDAAGTFVFRRLSPTGLVLEGDINGDTLEMRLERVPDSQFLQPR